LWGRQIAAVRTDVSKTLRAEFETVPGRVRRLLRQRVATEIRDTTEVDAVDVRQTAALIAFLGAARDVADELAVNEITNSVWNELIHYVGATSELLIAALRGCAPETASFRRQQVDAAIAFSESLFGRDHAMRMRRSADHAAEEPAEFLRFA
jgi:hypothetical protein